MTTPAMNFVAVCANANIPLSGDKKLQLKHLRESGIPLPSSTTTSDAKERFAMLAWIRHAIANNIETSKWPSLLSTPLLATLRTLYAIPSARADAPAGETDLDRLSRVVAVYMPAALPADSPTSSKPSKKRSVAAGRGACLWANGRKAWGSARHAASRWFSRVSDCPASK